MRRTAAEAARNREQPGRHEVSVRIPPSGLGLASLLGGAGNQPDAEPQDDQVENHLSRDDEPRNLAGRENIPEADCREDGHGEVERIGPGQGFCAEVGATGQRHHEVGGGEQQQEEWDGRREGLDRSDAGEGGSEDRPDLVGRHRGQDEQSDDHAREQRYFRQTFQGCEVVRGDQDRSSPQRPQQPEDDRPTIGRHRSIFMAGSPSAAIATPSKRSSSWDRSCRRCRRSSRRLREARRPVVTRSG